MVSNLSCKFGYGINQIQNLNFVPHSKTLGMWVTKPDKFERASTTFEDKEINRLFPNGELNKIYNHIAKEYGLENLPDLELIKDFSKGDRGYYTATNNRIKLFLDFLKPESRKFLVEKDGNKFYMVGDSRGLLFRTKEADIQNEKNTLNSLGFEVTPEPLTDDDKKKLTVFLLAHELFHAYQHQIIRQTEGLSEWEMLETKLFKTRPKGLNLIQQKLEMINFKQQYEKTHLMMNFDKKYSLNSPEGEQAKIWYNSNVNYIKPENDYQANINNPLEVDTNKNAYHYLKNHFGYFEDAIEF